MKTFQGVYHILVTTFDAEGKIDIESQRALTEYLIRCGAHGLGLFGNASEGYALTAEERRTLLTEIVKWVKSRVPLIVSSGHTSTWGAVELSREARDMGADGLMVLPPYLMKTDGEGLVRYFDEISKAAQIPVMVQDAPLMTNVSMPAPLLARMAREIEHVTLAKVEAPPTAPKVTDVAKLAGDKLTIFGGLNAQFHIEEYDRCARGTMPGSDLTAPLVAIWNALESGDRDRAWKIFTACLPLLRFELQPGMGVSAMKHNLVAEGVIRHATVRPPTASLGPESVTELEFLRRRTAAALAELGV